MSKIQLGDKARDIITGFEGIVISRIEYLNGCVQFGIKARVEDAALREAEYIDESQLERIDGGINEPKEEQELIVKKRPSGGDQPDRPRRVTSPYYRARKRN